MIFTIQKVSFVGALLCLSCSHVKATADVLASSASHPHASSASWLSPSLPRAVTLSADQSSADGNKMKPMNKIAFTKTSEGILVASSQPLKVSQEEFAIEIEPLLKDPKIKYVVIDSREDYSRDGDKIVRGNISLVEPWYSNVLEHSSLTEDQIYKLVWLPSEKVMDDLMNGMSFWPEGWLLSMRNYQHPFAAK